MKRTPIMLSVLFLLSGCMGEQGFQVEMKEIPPAADPAPVDDGILDIGEEYAGGIFAGDSTDESYKLVVTPGNCTNAVTPVCDGTADTVDFDRWNGWLYCDGLDYGGYTDWHVPDFYQVNQLYSNRSAIGGFREDVFYWTSWQDYYSTWHVVDFSNGNDLIVYDTEFHLLRCVREEYPAPPPI